MKVLVNAISITEGGGLVVLMSLLESMSKLTDEIEWYVIASDEVLNKIIQGPTIHKISCGQGRMSSFQLWKWYEIELHKIIKLVKADLLFSLTNFLPRRKISCKSLLLVHHAGYFSTRFKDLNHVIYPSFKNKLLWHLKERWVKSSIVSSDHITVQTKALANSIMQSTKISADKISVVEHGPGLMRTLDNSPQPIVHQDILKIAYITKYGVQKDFKTAFSAVRKLNDIGVKCKLILTLDENTDTFKYINNDINYYGVSELIENHGEVSNKDKIRSLYLSSHLFVFPSLCESFGFTLIEAMSMSLPIIAANTESNRELIGSDGLLFEPENANDLFKKIMHLVNNQEIYSDYAKRSSEKSKKYNWDNAAKKLINLIENKYPKE